MGSKKSFSHISTIQSLLYTFSCDLILGHIGITIGGHESTVDEDEEIIKRNGPILELHLNITRFNLISASSV